jgi:hypothetical protein
LGLRREAELLERLIEDPALVTRFDIDLHRLDEVLARLALGAALRVEIERWRECDPAVALLLQAFNKMHRKKDGLMWHDGGSP